jgi:hypothetical protein
MRGVISFQYAPGSTTVIGNAVPLSMLVIVAQQDSGRPVIDKTDGKQLYDFALRFSPDRMASNNRGEPPRDATAAPVAVDPVAPLSAALQEQLGLKLHATCIDRKSAVDLKRLPSNRNFSSTRPEKLAPRDFQDAQLKHPRLSWTIPKSRWMRRSEFSDLFPAFNSR